MEWNDWTIGQLIFGLVIAGVGFIVVWRAEWMHKNFGIIPFAEKYLSAEGGTRIFYKFIGILIMIIGIMHATDLLERTASALYERWFGAYLL